MNPEPKCSSDKNPNTETTQNVAQLTCHCLGRRPRLWWTWWAEHWARLGHEDQSVTGSLDQGPCTNTFPRQ